MKKIVLPIAVFVTGLVVAQVFFGVDVEALTEGFFEFLGGILGGRS